jgi:hypothetical protein
MKEGSDPQPEIDLRLTSFGELAVIGGNAGTIGLYLTLRIHTAIPSAISAVFNLEKWPHVE